MDLSSVYQGIIGGLFLIVIGMIIGYFIVTSLNICILYWNIYTGGF